MFAAVDIVPYLSFRAKINIKDDKLSIWEKILK